jgi:mannose-1-phosphate guanylyltransferase
LPRRGVFGSAEYWTTHAELRRFLGTATHCRGLIGALLFGDNDNSAILATREAVMSETRRFWALILAAGDGSRLRALTTRPCGTSVPKQFCSLRGGRSLLEDAVDRARGVVETDRICTIVAHQHRQWWSGMDALAQLDPDNLVVQPRNRGTAIGILYAVMHILAKEPDARVLVLPADHYVRDEATLRQSLRQAMEHVALDQNRPVLLGMEPDELDPDLGYIVPGGPDPFGGQGVERFTEKPDHALAAQMLPAGALWNMFIIAARAATLVDLFLPRFAPLVMEMQVMVSRSLAAESPTAGWPAIVSMYERLPCLDFSRDILELHESSLCVMEVPRCGWSDLGTPRRVGLTLARLRPYEYDAALVSRSAYMNLAAQHASHRLAQHAAQPAIREGQPRPGGSAA